jgi:hypothetical protein
MSSSGVGRIRPVNKLERSVVTLCLSVVEIDAQVGDKYTGCPVPGFLEDTVGPQIRAELDE